MKAILVDGVGATREMEIQHDLYRVRIPIPRPVNWAVPPDAVPTKADIISADFVRIGSVPDGRYVYGYLFSSGGQYELWMVTASWVPSVDECGLLAVRQQVETQITALASEPIVRLYDRERADPSTGLVQRFVMGVARKGSSA